VNGGGFDAITEIADLVDDQRARRRIDDIWFHIDGAFGLWVRAGHRHRVLAMGSERADSWTCDAHKWLNVPYDCGVVFVRDGEALKAAMSITADYLMTESEFRNPSDYTPELSRRARGVDVWAALKALGRSGIAEMIDRCCSHARRFAAGLEAAGFPVLNDVVLNQVLVSFGDDARTRRIIDAIQADGTCWCGVTVWQGQTAMRISVCNWSTTQGDVDQSLDAIIRIARSEVVDEGE
jgi:glutamate/tyrosine decarboxylase-like PLP-dependent enzyme